MGDEGCLILRSAPAATEGVVVDIEPGTDIDVIVHVHLTNSARFTEWSEILGVAPHEDQRPIE